MTLLQHSTTNQVPADTNLIHRLLRHLQDQVADGREEPVESQKMTTQTLMLLIIGIMTALVIFMLMMYVVIVKLIELQAQSQVRKEQESNKEASAQVN